MNRSEVDSGVVFGEGWESQLDLPYLLYESLRHEGNVVWDPAQRAWLVLDFETCSLVLRREELFAHPDRREFHTPESYAVTEEVVGGPTALILLQDQPHRMVHTRLMKDLTTSGQRYRVELVRPLVESLVARFRVRGSADFVEEFAELLPNRAVAAILGLPINDEELLRNCKRYNDEIAACRMSLDVPEAIMERGRQAAVSLDEVLLPVVRARMKQPRDDLISRLWSLGVDALPSWDESDVLAQCRVLFFAGSESTSHFLCNLGYFLFTQPALHQVLGDNPNLAGPFVEEVLRTSATVQFRMRIATDDCELSGVQIKRGDRVYPVIAAGNRDPNRFESPGLIKLDRRALTAHLAFNVGPRTCPGAPLARVEGIETTIALCQLRGLRLDRASAPPRFHGTMNTSIRPLLIRFESE